MSSASDPVGLLQRRLSINFCPLEVCQNDMRQEFAHLWSWDIRCPISLSRGHPQTFVFFNRWQAPQLMQLRESSVLAVRKRLIEIVVHAKRFCTTLELPDCVMWSHVERYPWNHQHDSKLCVQDQGSHKWRFYILESWSQSRTNLKSNNSKGT